MGAHASPARILGDARNKYPALQNLADTLGDQPKRQPPTDSDVEALSARYGFAVDRLDDYTVMVTGYLLDEGTFSAQSAGSDSAASGDPDGATGSGEALMESR